QSVLPIEVKAGTQGGMKSLWLFMREKKLEKAIRCSLENFGSFENQDKEETAQREVLICPIYAVSMLRNILLN
ncbi:MAG: ATP-binding protein, partial [Bacteroidales bacterium]|nr:ATP-binding protein [Bacteroidales bacterium]